MSRENVEVALADRLAHGLPAGVSTNRWPAATSGLKRRTGASDPSRSSPHVGCRPTKLKAAARRRLGPREAEVPRRQRLNVALFLLSAAIIINLILLFSGDTSPGWPLASVILLGAAGAAMLSQRREP